MTYLSLYRKYRSQNFEEIVGQGHVARTLKNAVEGGRVAHAYLFSGPRGTGKTSVARIFAKSLNCETGPTAQPCGACDACRAIATDSLLDVIEIDAASNRGIDDIRELKEKVRFPPTQARFKVYIIDEAHMLTDAAFNALLKTLEEPPERVVFLLATTEPQKLMGTILSRCQRFDFRRLSDAEILGRLQDIAGRESVEAETAALERLVRMADGSMRDAISLLDQLVSYSGGTIAVRDVDQMLGAVDAGGFCGLLEEIVAGDAGKAFERLERFAWEGKSFSLFVRSLIEFLRDLYFIKEGLEPPGAVFYDGDARKRASALAEKTPKKVLFGFLEKASETEERLKDETRPRILVETLLIRLLESRVAADGERRPRVVRSAGDRREANVESVAETPLPRQEGLPAAAAGPVDLNLDSAKANWSAVLGRIRSESPPLFFITEKGVLMDAQPGRLTLGFDREFNRNQVKEEKHRKAIEGILERFFIGPTRLHCVLTGEDGGGRVAEPAAEAGGAPPAKDPARPADEGKSLSEKALSMFPGAVEER